jgi:hypothetical protein
VSLPAPQPGLVISYAYLWAREHGGGAEEGRKNRPCAIIDPADAVEIPASLKAHLGLDDLPSWIVVTETNDFLWPGPDLRPLPGAQPSRFDYGMLPPRFFAHIRDRLLQAHLHRKLSRVPRSE